MSDRKRKTEPGDERGKKKKDKRNPKTKPVERLGEKNGNRTQGPGGGFNQVVPSKTKKK